MHSTWLKWLFSTLASVFPDGFFLSDPNIMRGLLAVLLVCFVCGTVGSLVVGNRMAFFSDALAHCTFAGVALGLLTGLLAGFFGSGLYHWVNLVMVLFGALVGVGIVYVREKTTLASDTVIGVFFAGAIGFGAMLLQALGNRSPLKPEQFLFGDPIWLSEEDFLVLLVLAAATIAFLGWLYNRLVFASFNASLARSRRIPLRVLQYVFVVLLALIVNLSLKTVGALLINSLLILPAATAGNLSRNLREMFWLSLGLSLTAGVGGAWIASTVYIPVPDGGRPIAFGWGGTIVVLSTLLFFASMIVGPWMRGARAAE